MKRSPKLRMCTASLLAATGAASVASAATGPNTTQVTQTVSDDAQFSPEEISTLNAEADKEAAALQAAGIPFEVITEGNGLRWVDVTSTDEAVLDKADKVLTDIENEELAAFAD